MKNCKKCKITFEKLYLETVKMSFNECGCCIWKFCLSNYSNIEKANKSSDRDRVKVLNIFFDEHKKKENKI